MRPCPSASVGGRGWGWGWRRSSSASRTVLRALAQLPGFPCRKERGFSECWAADNELLKALGFPIGGEVINVLALYVINPGGTLRGLETKGLPSPQFGCFFFFSKGGYGAGHITQIITFSVSAWMIELDSSCSVQMK